MQDRTISQGQQMQLWSNLHQMFDQSVTTTTKQEAFVLTGIKATNGYDAWNVYSGHNARLMNLSYGP